MTLSYRFSWILGLIVLLAACNGGRGHLTNGSTAVEADSASKIEGGNGDASAVLGDSGGPTAQILTTEEGIAVASLAHSIVEFAADKTSPLLQIVAMAEQFAASAITDSVIDSSTATLRLLSGDCSAGGGISYTAPPLGKENFVTGDEVTLRFQDCSGTRMLRNGVYSIKVDSGSTLSGIYTATQTFTNYSAVAHDGATSLAVNGSIRTSVTADTNPERYVQTSVKWNQTVNGASAELRNYEATIEHNPVTNLASYRANFDVNIDIPDHNSTGLLKVKIDPPWTASLDNASFSQPVSGVMEILGTSGASVYVDAATESAETLSLNVNGSNQVVFWSDLH